MCIYIQLEGEEVPVEADGGGGRGELHACMHAHYTHPYILILDVVLYGFYMLFHTCLICSLMWLSYARLFGCFLEGEGRLVEAEGLAGRRQLFAHKHT